MMISSEFIALCRYRWVMLWEITNHKNQITNKNQTSKKQKSNTRHKQNAFLDKY
jgi:hypothetical protein